MSLRAICPVCSSRLSVNLRDGILLCPKCGYQPLFDMKTMAEEAHRVQIHPLSRKGMALAEGEMIECQACGGDNLEPVFGENMIRCTHCDTTYTIQPMQIKPKVQNNALRDMLLSCKNQAIKWEITERLLTCQSCGSQVTLTPEHLNATCPFCDSHYVVTEDNYQSFEAPDAFIPFVIDGEQARQRVQQTLDKGLGKFIEWAKIRDKIVEISGQPLYLPWWLFDVNVEALYRYEALDRYGHDSLQHVATIPVYAALADSAEVPKINTYNLRQLIDYAPDVLGAVQAEIYQVDVAQALANVIPEAIKITKKEVRKDRARSIQFTNTMGMPQSAPLRISCKIKETFYRFVLLPVWVILLHEEDGDVRRALVNGQTGTVHLEPFSLWGKPSPR